MFESLNISASGLRAQRAMMNVISQNIANASSTRDIFGKSNPYRRREILLSPGNGRMGVPFEGVSVVGIQDDMRTDFRKVEDPNHPDAVQSGPDKGKVLYPNVNILMEMVDMMVASRAYEANVTAMDATKSIIESSFRILA